MWRPVAEAWKRAATEHDSGACRRLNALDIIATLYPNPVVSPVRAMFERGTHFAGHVIVQLLGAGRIAEVYEVVAPDGARLALKVLKIDDTPLDAKPNARLGQEGEAIATIEHVNVVRFHDAGRDAGRVWILLELVHGPDLWQLVRDAGGTLPPARAVSLVRQVCEGVAAAHALGILHRDLTPGNILVAPGDLAKVADFGSAKLERGSVKTTSEIGRAHV